MFHLSFPKLEHLCARPVAWNGRGVKRGIGGRSGAQAQNQEEFHGTQCRE